jgi:hypothetical protein
MKVVLSGLAYQTLEGGGLFQSERPDIRAAFHGQRAGFGWRMSAQLSAADARTLLRALEAYARAFSGPGLDADDAQSRRDGAACARDAKRLRAALD